MAFGVALGMVSWAVFQHTGPSTDDLQRHALDELGLGPGLEAAMSEIPSRTGCPEAPHRATADPT